MRLFILFLCFFIQFGAFSQTNHKIADTLNYKIVVLGSSTAAGTGPKKEKNTWVNRYRRYIKSIIPNAEVVNLAVGGYTTYHLMPSDFTAPENRQKADTIRNITAAVAAKPDVIIVNLPSNDIAWGYDYDEQMKNFDIIMKRAEKAKIDIWLCTTQPRNFEPEIRTLQYEMKDSMERIYEGQTIDFWTDFASDDHSINGIYNAGDGVHMNDDAHAILFKLVAETVTLPIRLPITNAEIISTISEEDELMIVSPPHSEKGPCKLCRKKKREKRKAERLAKKNARKEER